MPLEIEVTLGELARIALGSPDFGPANIAVLHSLIDLLLAKLDCRDERVSIGGYESSFLKKLLTTTSAPLFGFEKDQLVIIPEKFERVGFLERRVEAVEKRLENHFKEIEECNKNMGFLAKHDQLEHYAYACEDLYYGPDPQNVVACQLIKSPDFMKKVLRNISRPLTDRLSLSEDKILKLHEEFKEFAIKTNEHYLSMGLVERCIHEIEYLRQQINEHHTQFHGAMEEVQEMFDAKLDKIHLPALKKFIRDRFDNIENTLTILQAKKPFQESASPIMEELRCLSCGCPRVCPDNDLDRKGTVLEGLLKTNLKTPKKYCGCVKRPAGELKDAFSAIMNVLATSCPSNVHEYLLKEGTDHEFYRVEPNAKLKTQEDYVNRLVE